MASGIRKARVTYDVRVCMIENATRVHWVEMMMMCRRNNARTEQKNPRKQKWEKVPGRFPQPAREYVCSSIMHNFKLINIKSKSVFVPGTFSVFVVSVDVRSSSLSLSGSSGGRAHNVQHKEHQIFKIMPCIMQRRRRRRSLFLYLALP